MNWFLQAKEILDDAVGGPDATVPGPYGLFWRPISRDQFVTFAALGNKVVTVNDGANSTLVKALRGEQPFVRDTGTAGASFRRMPACLKGVPTKQIDRIASWIDDGCPEDDDQPVGTVEITCNGAGPESAPPHGPRDVS